MEFPHGGMVKGGEAFSHKCSRITGIKIAILSFKKNLSHLTIHVQVDNKVALEYLLKMGGTRNPQFLKINKSIWNYLLSHQIKITSEYLPSRLNVRADWESRNATDSSDWKLHQKVFLKITKLLGTPSVDLFDSRLCHQLLQYKARSKQFCSRCNAAGLEQNVCFCIPTFQLDRSGDKQSSSGKCRSNDTSDIYMADTTLVYSPTRNVYTMSIAFTSPTKPIAKSPGRKTSSC